MDRALAHLTIRDRALIELLGGVFPERGHDLAGFTRVLDIACGTGSWAVRVAYENPQIEAIGIEHHSQLVDCASGLAETQNVENARFILLSNEQTRFPFPDQHFDLIHAHFLFSWLSTEAWPAFIQECLRMTRPGGFLCLIEPEWTISGDSAPERFFLLFSRALKQAGHGLSPDGKELGIVSQLPVLLQQAGATEITRRTYTMEEFLSLPMARDPVTQLERLAQLFSPLIISQGIATAEQIAQVLQEARLTVKREDFSHIAFIVSACGRKPTLQLA